MRIVIDHVIDNQSGNVIGEMVFHTEDELPIQHAHDNTRQMTMTEFLQELNVNTQLREDTGWNISSQLEGEGSPKTRWMRLVDHTNSENGDPKLKELGLKH